jgi:hypothetical protein
MIKSVGMPSEQLEYFKILEQATKLREEADYLRATADVFRKFKYEKLCVNELKLLKKKYSDLMTAYIQASQTTEDDEQGISCLYLVQIYADYVNFTEAELKSLAENNEKIQKMGFTTTK